MTDALSRSLALIMLVALGSTSGIAGAQQVRLRIGLVLPRLLVPAWVQ